MRFNFRNQFMTHPVKFAGEGQNLPNRRRFNGSALSQNPIFTGVFTGMKFFPNVAQTLLKGGLQ